MVALSAAARFWAGISPVGVAEGGNVVGVAEGGSSVGVAGNGRLVGVAAGCGEMMARAIGVGVVGRTNKSTFLH